MVKQNITVHYANLISERLLNKPYVNEVTLSQQNQALKCCQSLEFLPLFVKGLRSFNAENLGSVN